MKVRIKFRKEGPVKFLGHLDTMRYFQKAIRRADIPVAFSSGYSPHMIMSFAVPLGVGTESTGDYFDLELREDMATSEITKQLNAVMVEGMEIAGTVALGDEKSKNAMSIVAAADYEIHFRENHLPKTEWKSRIADFLSQESIVITKQTKKSEKVVDIRPYIYEMRAIDNGIFYSLASASSNYTKPETVTHTFFEYLGETLDPHAFGVKRLELYANTGNDEHPVFTPLIALGEERE